MKKNKSSPIGKHTQCPQCQQNEATIILNESYKYELNCTACGLVKLLKLIN